MRSFWQIFFENLLKETKYRNIVAMINIEKLKNGLILIVEEVPHLESVSYHLSLPGGLIFDEADTIGSSLVLGEMVTRGAGDYDSKALSEAFEEGGIRHTEYAAHERFVLQGSLLSENMSDALRLIALMVKSPAIPSSELASIKEVLLQDLRALADNPSRTVLNELSKRYFPSPYNRQPHGEEKGIKNTTIDLLKTDHQQKFLPDGSVLSIAGNINTEKVRDEVERLFGNWEGKGPEKPPFDTLPKASSYHIEKESAQLQIALAYPSAPFNTEHYYAAKVALGILSGGMFGRLFIEVREKRGLCYSVYARHSASTAYGVVTAYAGTTPERAEETLVVMLEELRQINGTIKEEELKRAKANIIASIVISDESPAARASSNAQDYISIGRVRSLDEIRDKLQAVKISDIDNFFTAFPVKSICQVTLGSKDLSNVN